MRYLAIDHGRKRTGLAICDPSETIVSPLAVIKSEKKLLDEISELLESEGVEAIVLGLPLNMDNSIGLQAKLVMQFAEKLKKRFDVPIHFYDERLSTFAAEEKLAAAELTKKKKAQRIDAVAAAEILQFFLDRKNTE